MRSGSFEFLRRLSDMDIRLAGLVTCLTAIAVFALGRLPLSTDLNFDLRGPDQVAGWSHLSVVGFSISFDYGRSAPTPPGREDVRIVTNRPLPRVFELELEGWWMNGDQHPDLEIGLGVIEGYVALFLEDAQLARLVQGDPARGQVGDAAVLEADPDIGDVFVG